ncbi:MULTISPECIES: Stp1/IreP family PP2C-type Ser/Thr phosphatase [Clostridium]|uniref:protein-serine/threonine phosphatase n=1 Tax=Clostridium novyi (strain NT) TaxID=386415 RepID=A0Q111_CLONN|nr:MULTISPECIES: Stp1/IreP family PP2C-type Ser/Thr phosphatase [Clostridium]ABK60926.1 PP2C phosphatase family, putative [Clostridium novyi NT]KEH85104.1 protein phosphatase [Clostridium novyi A str. NCTC 538]KEH85848.1 protein phosphatase [Clostridium novyi A str. 4540]KEH85892.1 protein phosphatase [Clostridium novyi A str. BKT29909]KEH91908.1 protein phosphatase [Clostridium novyi A str. GD211209]
MNSSRIFTEKLCVGLLSDIGNVREINEDSIGKYENDEFAVYIVADGMGGHNAGDVASKIAVESCIEYIKRNRYLDDMERLLKESIKYANNNIYIKAENSEMLYGMGTTITACIVKQGKVVIANVGDSSCYIVTEENIEKITKDHSLVQELVDDGSITEEEAINHPNKNIITRALGTKKTVKIDTFSVDISYNEKFVLCTDGLSNEVSKEEMYSIISQNTNQEACRLLVDLCKNKSGRDNISVIIFGGMQK